MSLQGSKTSLSVKLTSHPSPQLGWVEDTLGHIDLKKRNSISGLIRAYVTCIIHSGTPEGRKWDHLGRIRNSSLVSRIQNYNVLSEKEWAWQESRVTHKMSEGLIIIIKFVMLAFCHCDKKKIIWCYQNSVTGPLSNWEECFSSEAGFSLGIAMNEEEDPF